MSDRISELESLIVRYQKSYYTGEAEISDAEFDKLWDELKQCAPESPVLHRIGSDLADDRRYAATGNESAAGQPSPGGTFEKVRHLMPMGSQEKAANPGEFEKWALKMDFPRYLVEYKLDGASIELQYENGVFSKAVTRGDGTIGDDITKNVLKMKGLVKELLPPGQVPDLFAEPLPLTGGIRGEVIMTHRVHDRYFSDKANCRNAANGLMKRKDGTGSEYLQIICYDAFFSSTGSGGQPFSTETEKMQWLEAVGFTVSPLRICESAQEVIDYRVQVMELRRQIPYDIDGLVVKNDRIDAEDAARARPEKQIAFKFSLEEAVSILRDVIWNESGATYTPVAIFDEVELAGTKVKRASLVNPNTIAGLGIQIGSHVVVTKRGEIIPKIEYVLRPELVPPEKRDPAQPLIPIEQPSVCAVCGTALTDEGTRLYCPNRQCKKRILHQLEKWISVCDIRDFGTTLIKSLFNAGILRSIADIYSLTESALTPFFLAEESLAEDKISLGARKVLASIQSRRTVPLPVFIAGLDIEGIGETLVEKLEDAGFNTVEKLLAADENAIAGVYGFAEITAHALCAGLAENRALISRLLSDGIITVQEKAAGNFTGKSFCFTGELHTMKRSEAEALVKAGGGSVKSSVVKGLSYLVTNDRTSGSSKNKKAAGLGIPVIDESEFLALAGR